MEESTFATIPGRGKTVSLSGELDLASRHSLRATFEEAAATSCDVTVDMTEVTYMDSSAISALISLHRELYERNRSMRIRMRRNAAYRLLEIAGLNTIFEMEIVG